MAYSSKAPSSNDFPKNSSSEHIVLKKRVISFLWGFAEATFFFVVPDVWLSALVLGTEKREAYINIAFASLGALLGGVLIYFLAAPYFDEVRGFFDYVPAISDALITETKVNIEQAGMLYALFEGMFLGIPYKLHAFWAGVTGYGFLLFLAASMIARTFRFLVIVGLAHGVSIALTKRLKLKQLFILHGVCWVVFYVCYFAVMGI